MKSGIWVGLCLMVMGCGKKSEVHREETTREIFIDDEEIAAETPRSACPSDMVEVEGMYCSHVQEMCEEWVDMDGKASEAAIPLDGESGRCGRWKYPTKCLSEKRIHKHYCIDVYEYPNIKGQKPQTWLSWYDAKKIAESIGKRLCTQSEWTFAAEGEDMHPLPYGDGYHRTLGVCNFDNHLPKGFSQFKARQPDDEAAKVLDDLLVPAGSMSGCASIQFGIHEMAGNADEWVISESGGKFPSGLMSGHILGVRNRARAITNGHGPSFAWFETGARFCKDITE